MKQEDNLFKININCLYGNICVVRYNKIILFFQHFIRNDGTDEPDDFIKPLIAKTKR